MNRPPTYGAGEWLGLAERVAALQADLAGTVLAPQWPQSLEFLRGDCLEMAGRECVHEVAGDGLHVGRRAA